MMRALRPALAALAILLAGAPPGSADDNDGTAVIAATDDPIRLAAGSGRLVRLPREIDSLFVAAPDIADVQLKSPQLIYVFGRAPGRTDLYGVDADDTVVLDRRIEVEYDLEALRSVVEETWPEARVDFRTVGGSILIQGSVLDAAAAADIGRLAGQQIGDPDLVMNRLEITTPNQVTLQVRVAEVSRSVSKRLGFNLDVTGSIGSLGLALATGNPLVDVSGIALTDGLNANGLIASGTTGRWNVAGLIDALEEQGLISVLAEPTLTAMSGETATFLAGGEFPIPIPQSDGNLSIEFRRYGVALSFSPTVVSAGRITVRVRPEVSQLTDAGAINVSGFQIPALLTRRTETTVEVGSGQSFAIAGLLQAETDQALNQFPGLGDLPVLGALFRSDRFRRNETELVIIVTPYLVRPSDGRLVLPTDNLQAPSDAQRLLSGAIYQPRLPDPDATAEGAQTPRLAGPVGFILN